MSLQLRVPTYILNQIIADDAESAALTIQQFKDAQLALLPYDCPKCADTSGLIQIVYPNNDGVPTTVVCDICQGYGRTATEYTASCANTVYTPVTDDGVD